MASDSSIKQIESPAAAAVPAPPGAGADGAVATGLAAHQSVAPADIAPHLRLDPQSSTAGASKQVMLDRNAGAIVYEVVDNRTSLVVRQFPDQQFLRRRAYARALEQAREDALALRIDLKI